MATQPERVAEALDPEERLTAGKVAAELGVPIGFVIARAGLLPAIVHWADGSIHVRRADLAIWRAAVADEGRETRERYWLGVEK